jgi:two-component system, response regulator RegA
MSWIVQAMVSVLIIDDDAQFAKQLARSLERRGFHCQHAANLTEATQRVEQQIFAHVLLDLKLGNESALQAIAAIRAKQTRAKIILLTGYASVATAVKAIKLGADDYLPKPASMAQLLQAMSEDAEGIVENEPEYMLRLQRLEWEHIQQALLETGGNVSAAARLLGLHRRSLQRKLDKKPLAERTHS